METTTAPAAASAASGSATSRIHSIRATPINVPLEAPYLWAAGVFNGMSKTIVEVQTEDGVVGLGEAPTPWAAHLINEHLAPRLVGADPRDLVDCERRALMPVGAARNSEDLSSVRAYGAVEMALWDIAGWLAGVPVSTLLGGRWRDELTYTEYFAPRLRVDGRGGEQEPAELAAYCARMAEEHGAVRFEGKLGIFDTARELRMVTEIRRAIGDEAMLRLDANQAWSVGEARAIMPALEAAGVSSIEEPVPSTVELARLRETTSIAFSTHDPDLRSAALLGVPDAFVINLAALGGIRRTVAFVHACAELGVDVWFYSPDTGIGNAAYLQVGAALEHLDKPSQTLLRWQQVDIVAEGPFAPRDGKLTVPTGPGLGVTLDRHALDRCHQHLLDHGPFEQYADPAKSGYFHR